MTERSLAGRDDGLRYLGPDRGLPRREEGLDQRPFAADRHLTEALEPRLLRHGGVGVDPVQDLHQFRHSWDLAGRRSAGCCSGERPAGYSLNSIFTEAKASIANCRSSRECAADTCVRMRARPWGT